MKKILLIKTGSAMPATIKKCGDFDDMAISGMGIKKSGVLIVEVFNGHPLPDYDLISGIVITGSHDNVTNRREWMEKTAKWLPGAVEREIPILAICFGHQLLAYALGGKVAYNPKGNEFGTVDIKLHSNAQNDLLFKEYKGSFKAHVVHSQSVTELPPNTKLLASSAMEPHQSYVIGKNAWGVQFHPEFDLYVVKEYIRRYFSVLKRGGKNPLKLIENCVETPKSKQLLHKFVEIVNRKP